MSVQTHSQTANFIWSICNLLRGPYKKRNEYRKVILPLTILRRFDCILEPTKDSVLKEFDKLKGKSENIVSAQLRTITGVPFYNLSKLTFKKLLDEKNMLFNVVKKFASDEVDLSPANSDELRMGYVFEELIRITGSAEGDK